jgi:hypothetical protein
MERHMESIRASDGWVPLWTRPVQRRTGTRYKRVRSTGDERMVTWDVSWKVPSSSGNSAYVVSCGYTNRDGPDIWGCTCPRWINQQGSPEERSPCKHIRYVRGELISNGILNPDGSGSYKEAYVRMREKHKSLSNKETKKQHVSDKQSTERWKYLEI